MIAARLAASRRALRRTFAERSTAYAAWVLGGSPLFTEAIARVGYDAVVLDYQHGVGDLLPMITAVAAAPAKPRAVVRIPQLLDGEIYKALDAGADTLICPMINSAAECAAFVSACLYPPAGHRS